MSELPVDRNLSHCPGLIPQSGGSWLESAFYPETFSPLAILELR